MAKAENNVEAENTNKEIEKINAIRDIIFGSDMQEYDHKFETLKKDLDDRYKKHKKDLQELQKTIDNKLDELKDTMMELKKQTDTQIDSLTSDVNQELDTLRDDKTERRTLGALLEELGRKLQSED